MIALQTIIFNLWKHNKKEPPGALFCVIIYIVKSRQVLSDRLLFLFMLKYILVIIMDKIQNLLFQFKDGDYKTFNSKLIPNLKESDMIGIRIPDLRKIAKDIYTEEWIGEFLNELPHRYFEENNLHAFIIEQEKDFFKALELTERFLPYIDNWATCDSFFPKVFRKNIEIIDQKIELWLTSDKEYTVRYALGLIMRLHLKDNYDERFLDKASAIRSDKYYINMMIAWLFATALVYRKDVVIDYFKSNKLPTWVHNKAIQKAIESYRIDNHTKELIKKYKIPNNA